MVQEHLASTDPGNPVRIFGEAVECASEKELSRKRFIEIKVPDTAVPLKKRKTIRLAALENSLLFSDMVKKECPEIAPARFKEILLKSYETLIELVATDEGKSRLSVRKEFKDLTFGLKAKIPVKYEELARVSIVHNRAPASSAHPTGDMRPGRKAAKAPSRARSRTSFSAEGDEHSTAKDIANRMWISKLSPGGKIFFLDSWVRQEGMRLRTVSALREAGHSPENLYSANPDPGIVEQLRREGVNSEACRWEEFSFPSINFNGIYLDLCSGSGPYLQRQLEIASSRASKGCRLGFTVIERDFNGEALLLRCLALQDYLTSENWEPSMQGFRPSTLLHRSGASKQKVLTQFWTKVK